MKGMFSGHIPFRPDFSLSECRALKLVEHGIESPFSYGSQRLPTPRSAPRNACTAHILVFPQRPHLRKCRTSQQNRKKHTTPPQKTNLSCFALLSTIRIVSPDIPNVFATLYNLLCVPFSISLCCPRSPRTARPRSKNSSSWVLELAKKDCSRRACASR